MVKKKSVLSHPDKPRLRAKLKRDLDQFPATTAGVFNPSSAEPDPYPGPEDEGDDIGNNNCVHKLLGEIRLLSAL